MFNFSVLYTAIFFAIFFGALFAIWFGPGWHVRKRVEKADPEKRFELENESRKTLAQIAGGAVVIAGLFFTWFEIENTRKSVAISETRQFSERFSRAIEHISSSKMHVRIGGIYSLEQLAKESQSDRLKVLKILAAYIREISTWKQGASLRPSFPPDLQASIDVISHLNSVGTSNSNGGQVINLSKTDLRRADLSKRNFAGANFEFSHIENADLRDTLLSGANLINVNFERSNLLRAQLDGAKVYGAILREATITSTNFSQTNINADQLREATFDRLKPPILLENVFNEVLKTPGK